MNIQSQLRYLRLHAFLSTSTIVVLITTAFTDWQKTRFETIDVERINVVEKNGQIRLVISNKDRSPAPMERGQEFGYQPGNRAGMIFYNEEGTENGGLTYTGRRDSAGKYSAIGSLTFDQYEQDQQSPYSTATKTVAVDQGSQSRTILSAGRACSTANVGSASTTLETALQRRIR